MCFLLLKIELSYVALDDYTGMVRLEPDHDRFYSFITFSVRCERWSVLIK